METGTRPFKINIAQDILDDLKNRLKNTRWPDEIINSGWDYGTNLSYLKELVSYWGSEFDWRKQEEQINSFPQFMTEIGGLKIHFIYIKGQGKNPIPLLLLHGWPSTFIQMLKIAPLLSGPGKGQEGISFDLVIPSLVGYGFSDASHEPGMSVSKMAGIFHELMAGVLAYDKYALRGGDLGAGIALQMALLYPEYVIGLHTGGTYPRIIGELSDDLTAAEKAYVENVRAWMQEEAAYAQVHATKPQTLAYALNDSPAGLAAWIVEKFRKWSDCGGDVEKRFTKDELLTNLTIYWATQTINSSMRLYYETVRNPGIWGRIKVPTAALMPMKDMFPTPREWVMRTQNPTHYKEISRGGHFLEWEEPELVASDIREFFGSVV